MRARRTITWIAFVSIWTAISSVNAGDPAPQTDKRMKPALLVIDIQNEYMGMMSKDDKDLRMMMINATIELFRSKGFPIIRVHHTDPGYGPKPGTEAFEFPATVPVKPDDPRVIKNFPNAFKKTGLDQLLKDKGCNTVFLCGLSAVGCVLATHFGAREMDYETFMVKNAVLSHNAEYTRSIEDILDAVGYHTVKVMLDNAMPEKALK